MEEEVIYTWGWGEYGQLGHGDVLNQAAPKPIDRVMLQGQIVTHISCGFCFNVAVSKKGDVFYWGNARYCKVSNGGKDEFRDMLTSQSSCIPRKLKFFKKELNVKFVAAGREHALAILDSGEIYSWGDGVYGRLGHGCQKRALEPRQISWFMEGKNSIDPIKIKGAACGLDHTLAVDDRGVVYSWGLGLSGRLGHGNEETLFEPKRIENLFARHVEAVSVHCGWEHSAILSTIKGQVYTWGSGRSFQLGTGLTSAGAENAFSSVPTRVTKWAEKRKGKANAGNAAVFLRKPPRIVRLSCGGKHTLAVRENGSLYTWGRGELGRLGHGDQRHKDYPFVVQALADVKISRIAGGGYHSLALSEDGTLYAWGNNENGRLGLGSTEIFITKPTPLPSSRPSANSRLALTDVSAGAYQSVAFGNPLELNANSTMLSTIQSIHHAVAHSLSSCTIL